MTTQFQSEDFDRNPALSQTAWALQELQLYGTRAFQDEADLRPMPEPERLIDAVSDIFDALAATLGDTRMEPDLEELLWGQVNLFTAPPPAPSACSTTMKWRSTACSANRTAPK
jgi:hypothetical protein